MSLTVKLCTYAKLNCPKSNCLFVYGFGINNLQRLMGYKHKQTDIKFVVISFQTMTHNSVCKKFTHFSCHSKIKYNSEDTKAYINIA